MPYADREKQREAQRRWYREKYWREKEFREAEAERKAQWLQTDEGKLSNAIASAWDRKKRKFRKGPRPKPMRRSYKAAA